MDYSIVTEFSTWLSIYFYSIAKTLGTRMERFEWTRRMQLHMLTRTLRLAREILLLNAVSHNHHFMTVYYEDCPLILIWLLSETDTLHGLEWANPSLSTLLSLPISFLISGSQSFFCFVFVFSYSICPKVSFITFCSVGMVHWFFIICLLFAFLSSSSILTLRVACWPSSSPTEEAGPELSLVAVTFTHYFSVASQQQRFACSGR